MIKSIRLIFTGIIGNIFEWYEFSLFAYFAADIGQQFFPSHDKFTSLIEAFGVFAIGYLMRPLGAMWFGYFGDKLGRKKMLTTSIIAMATATTLIGFIPTYQSIGVLSGILLLACRMAQGFALGGEYSGSVVYLIEQSTLKHRGLWGSFALFGAYFGMLIGSFVSAIVAHLTHGTIYYDVAWRFCFISGAFLGLIGIYMRQYMPETPAFIEAEAAHQLYSNPLLSAFRLHSGTILKGVGITLLPAVTSYILFSYLPTHLSQFGGIPLDQALLLNTFSMIVMLIAIPLFGLLSDRIGRKPLFLLASILIGSFAYFAFNLFLSHSLLAIFSAQTLLALFSCCSEAIIPATLATIFPVSLRYTGIAICLNIANGVFGGSAALVATFMVSKTHNYSAPSFYLIAVAIISFISTLLLFKSICNDQSL